MRTIARFQQAEDAHLLRSFLASRGVEAVVLDEHVIQNFWHYSDAMGGVRVVVGDSQADDAVDVYREYLEALAESPRPVTVARAWPLVILGFWICGVPALIFGRRWVKAKSERNVQPSEGG